MQDSALMEETIPARLPKPRWRVGEKVPLNVYEGDRPVCQCHNATDAARIVVAMNAAESLLAAHP